MQKQRVAQLASATLNQIKQSPIKQQTVQFDLAQQQIHGLQQDIMLPFHLIINKISINHTNKKQKEFHQFLIDFKTAQKIYINTINSILNGLTKQSVFYAEKLFFMALQYQSQKLTVFEYTLYLYGLNKSIEGDFALLMGRSYYQSKQYEQAIDLLENQDNHLALYIKGQCFEALENKKEAVQYYQQSLIKNPVNVSIFNKLLDSFLISEKDKIQIVNNLKQSDDEEWISQYYKSVVLSDQRVTQLQPNNQLKLDFDASKQKKNESQEIANDFQSNNLFNLFSQKNNIDFQCIDAKKAYYQYDLSQALALCQKILSQNNLFFDIIPIYSACLVELEQVSELYNCAHNLIDNYPQQALSWLVVANYYYLTKKYEIARKHYQRAIQLDQSSIYAWIGLAHSYAVQDESDQSMSVYRSISRQFPGCYQSHIYIGMEYLRTNNLKTALQSFSAALEINPTDPMTYNEMGVVFFKQKQYQKAKEMFEKTLNLCSNQNFKILEISLQNLASCCRKLKNYKEAITLYEKCIQFNQTSAQTYFALAFTQHISGQPNSLCKAIQYYHKSLSLKPDQPFVQEMLGKCLNELAELGFQEYDL